mgnify:CR=1 FL=1
MEYRPQGYFEQVVPVALNLTKELNNTAADKVFLAANARGGQGLAFTQEVKMVKAFLIILGDVENTYDGENGIDCTTATHNQWQWDLNNGGFADLANGANADGQMLDNDWRCASKGAARSFAYQFDITSALTDVDGNIGIKLANGRAEQDGLNVTIHAYLKIVWKA